MIEMERLQQKWGYVLNRSILDKATQSCQVSIDLRNPVSNKTVSTHIYSTTDGKPDGGGYSTMYILLPT